MTSYQRKLYEKKKKIDKTTEDRKGRIRKAKFIQEQKEEEDDFSTLGYGAVPEQRARICGTVSVCDTSTASR